MRVIVPGDRVVVTNRLQPRDMQYAGDPTMPAYAGIPLNLDANDYWIAVDHLTNPTVKSSARAWEVDGWLWKGGWESR